MRLPKPAKRGAKTPKRIRRRVTTGARRRTAKAAGWVDPDSWQEVLRFYGGLCAYCRREPWSQQDHCVPLSRCGEHTIGNVVPSCHACNFNKGTQTWFPPVRHRWLPERRAE